MKKSNISREDQIEGIKRHPEFIKDFNEFIKLKKTDDVLANQKDDEIWDKWGLDLSCCPSIENIDINNYIDPECVSVVDKIIDAPIMIRCCQEVDGEYVYKPHIEKKGDRLYLKVDLRETKENILKKFEEKIDEYKKFYPTKNKNKTTSLPNYNKWDIYDLHHNKSMDFINITRKITGIDKKLTEDALLRADYGKVLRAYKKATEIIQAVGNACS